MPPAASVAAASYEMKQQDFADLQKLPGNKFCGALLNQCLLACTVCYRVLHCVESPSPNSVKEAVFGLFLTAASHSFLLSCDRCPPLFCACLDDLFLFCFLSVVDCGAPKPDWGSPKLGIFFCFRCSGIHRGLGTHISFVRSVTMDAWKDKEILLMKAGGNQQCLDFLRAHGIVENSSNSKKSSNDDNNDSSNLPLRNVPAKNKYDSPAAELYRQVLQARVDGLPEPTQLPVFVRTESSVSQHSGASSRKDAAASATATAATNNGNGRRVAVDKSRIQGFGSSNNNSSSGTVGGGGCIPSHSSGKPRTLVQKCLWVTATVVTLGGALWFANHHH
jgi:Putative GTPase activating protein for Arf